MPRRGDPPARIAQRGDSLQQTEYVSWCSRGDVIAAALGSPHILPPMEESADEGQVTPSAKRATLPTTPRSGLQSPAVGQDVGIEDSTPALRVRPCNLGTDDDDQDGRRHDAAGPRRPSGGGDDEDNGNAQFFDITEVAVFRSGSETRRSRSGSRNCGFRSRNLTFQI